MLTLEENRFRARELAPRNHDYKQSAICYVESMQAVLVMGGRQGTTICKTVERYLINEGTWGYLPSLNEARSEPSSCEHNDQVYVYGGMRSDSYLAN